MIRQHRIGSHARRGAVWVLSAAMASLATVVVAQTPAAAVPVGGTERLSVATGGAQGNSWADDPSISADGRYVAFVSNASNLVPNDTNGVRDVFLRDTLLQTTTRVSVGPDVFGQPTQANNQSRRPVVSGDGRYVAFISVASNLVANDTNFAWDVFVRDMVTQTTSRVSVSTGNIQGDRDALDRPSISADGRYVAFTSSATNMDGLVDSSNHDDIFVRDRQMGTTTRVSVSTLGLETNDDSWAPSISGNGRYVAFSSEATNIVISADNFAYDVYQFDTVTQTTAWISIPSGAVQVGGNAWAPSTSADGRYVAFQSEASNLVPSDTNGYDDIFVRDTVLGSTSRVSVGPGGAQGNGYSLAPSISADGRYVTFLSDATTLAGGGTGRDVFVRDRTAGDTTLVSVNGGTVPNSNSDYPAMSGDGRFVTYSSYASNLVPGDTNADSDVFRVGTAASTATPYRNLVAADGAVDYWPLGDSGSTVSPFIGGHSGSWLGSGRSVIAGATVRDNPNQASELAFCTSCYASIPSVPSSTLTGNSTIEIWFRSPGVGPDSYEFLIGSGPGTGGIANWSVEMWGNVGGGTLVFSSGRGNLFSTPILAVGDITKWVHLVVTLSGTNARMYANNVLVASSNSFASTYTPTGNTLVVGTYAADPTGDPGYHLGGAVQHAAIYPTALNATQVANHFQAAGRP